MKKKQKKTKTQFLETVAANRLDWKRRNIYKLSSLIVLIKNAYNIESMAQCYKNKLQSKVTLQNCIFYSEE